MITAKMVRIWDRPSFLLLEGLISVFRVNLWCTMNAKLPLKNFKILKPTPISEIANALELEILGTCVEIFVKTGPKHIE